MDLSVLDVCFAEDTLTYPDYVAGLGYTFTNLSTFSSIKINIAILPYLCISKLDHLPSIFSEAFGFKKWEVEIFDSVSFM